MTQIARAALAGILGFTLTATAAATGATLAQNQENVAEPASLQVEIGPQARDETNEYGWPTDYVAQVGAGVTLGSTTGYSGPPEPGGGRQEITLPPLPGADLCDPWEGTDAYPFCMEKVVQ